MRRYAPQENLSYERENYYAKDDAPVSETSSLDDDDNYRNSRYIAPNNRNNYYPREPSDNRMVEPNAHRYPDVPERNSRNPYQNQQTESRQPNSSRAHMSPATNRNSDNQNWQAPPPATRYPEYEGRQSSQTSRYPDHEDRRAPPRDLRISSHQPDSRAMEMQRIKTPLSNSPDYVDPKYGQRPVFNFGFGSGQTLGLRPSTPPPTYVESAPYIPQTGDRQRENVYAISDPNYKEDPLYRKREGREPTPQQMRQPNYRLKVS